jgi:ectoine hydroxylase
MSDMLCDVYPSRTGGVPGLCERVDPVLHGAPSGAASPEERSQFERNGYLLMPQLLGPADVDQLYADLTALARQERGAHRVLEPDTEAVRSVFEIHCANERLLQLLTRSRLLPMVQELLGGEVYVHQSRVNFKPAFDGREFYWHSDFETWHVEDGMPRMRALSLSLNLTENNAYNGPLMLIPGSHRHYASCPGRTPANHHEQSLRRQEYGVPTREQLAWLVEQGGIVSETGPAGSAVLFDSNLMHGSVANITPWPRCNVFIVFNSVENALAAPFSGLAPRPEHIASRRVTPLVAS